MTFTPHTNHMLLVPCSMLPYNLHITCVLLVSLSSLGGRRYRVLRRLAKSPRDVNVYSRSVNTLSEMAGTSTSSILFPDADTTCMLPVLVPCVRNRGVPVLEPSVASQEEVERTDVTHARKTGTTMLKGTACVHVPATLVWYPWGSLKV